MRYYTRRSHPWPSRVLSQVVSSTLSSKSAVSTRRSTSLRERTASTQAASEITDTKDVGQLTSSLFSQIRGVSANQFSVSGSEHFSMDFCSSEKII